MKNLLLLISLTVFVITSYGQDNFEILSKKKATNTLNRFDELNNSKYDEYDIIFSKKDSVDFVASTFLIEYYSGDSLVIAFDEFKKKSKQLEVALKFFNSQYFKDISYFVILYGKSIIEEDEKGDLVLKKFKPKSGIKKVAKKS